MERKTFIVSTFALVGLFLNFGVVFAYDDATTHPGLTSEVVSFYNATHPGFSLSDEERSWLVEGSRLEDTPPRWINHFFDPVHGVAWSGENEGSVSPYAVMLFARFGLSQKAPLTAVRWANADLEQGQYSYYGGDETWKKATNAYAKGDRKAAFIALGHVLHLAEDMSVPDHTRNDTHAPLKDVVGDEGSPYEAYAARYDEDSIKKLNITGRLLAEKKTALSEPTIEAHLTALANYSNRYFFSKDTISNSKFEYPKIVNESGRYGFGLDETGVKFPLVYIDVAIQGDQNTLLWRPILKNKEESRPILSAYFSRLSRQVVLHGAGIIDLFYKQSEDAKIAQEFPTHVLGADRSWGRLPVFSLYGELFKLQAGASQMFDNVAAKGRYVLNLFARPTESPERMAENEVDVPHPPAKERPMALSIEPKEETESAIVVIDEEESPIITVAATSDAPMAPAPHAKLVAVEEGAPAFPVPNSGGTSVLSPPMPVRDASWDGARIGITELMYDPLGADDAHEWVEIRNDGTSPVPVGKMRLVEGGTSHLISASGTDGLLTPGAYAVVAQDAAQFSKDWPQYKGPLFRSAFSLSNDGEALSITGGENILSAVSYASSSGARGNGNSLQWVGDAWRAARPMPGEASRENIPPAIVLTYAPFDAQIEELVRFNAASSTDEDGALISYAWDFGDGTYASSTEAITDHAYAAASTYSARLVATDNEGATSSREFSVAITPKGSRGVRHAVISELQVQGTDAGDEFIELYNPTDSLLDISSWSIQYVSGTESVSTSTVAKKNMGDGSVIPARGFFLIARGTDKNGEDGYRGAREADMIQRTFSLSAAESGGRVFLVGGREKITDAHDPAIIDAVDYGAQIPERGASIERKAWVSGACASALLGTDGEFAGHGCDSDAGSDFEVRTAANPQNAKNYPEPRSAPGVPAAVNSDGIARYLANAISLSFEWQPSNDFQGATSTVLYELNETDGASSTLRYSSSTPRYSMRIPQVGRTYSFGLRACDAEGLCSATSTAEIDAPSYFSNVYFSRDTRASSSAYLLDVYYDQYPFVPSTHGDIATARLIVFYLNAEPAHKTDILGSNADNFSDMPGALTVAYRTSYGSMSAAKGVVLPDGDSCPGYGPCSGDLAYSELEDKHLMFPLASSTNDLSLSPNDYVTVAFYDTSLTGGLFGPTPYVLVATDAKHYSFGEGPARTKPVLPGAVTVAFNKQSSALAISWQAATDRDTLDKNLTYDINFSPLGGINETRWAPSGTSYTRTVGIDDAYSIGVRAKDDFGNTSVIGTAEWRPASSTVFIAQTEADSWSDNFGFWPNVWSNDGSDTASFQSFTPKEDFQFNVVGLKLSQTRADDPAMARLSVYPDINGKPDFSNLLGQTTTAALFNPDREQERVFSFDTPVHVASSTQYWFALDVIANGNNIVYTRNMWANAIKLGDAYADGYAGQGYGQGANVQCTNECRVGGWNRVGSADWYMRIGFQE